MLASARQRSPTNPAGAWPTSARAPRGARWMQPWTTPSSVTIEPEGASAMTQRAARPMPAADLLRAAAEAAASKKALDMIGLDLSGLDGVADFFLICSGSSEPQVKAIAEAVEDQLRALGTKPWHVEG